jgi:2-polyprenyl-3-methyl-5-hydroxy-6-metoxy-1,4-benzoquinol methylase
MFGSAYWRHPDALARSLREINEKYRDGPIAADARGLTGVLQRYYVRLLGIPEIGFRVRGWYFNLALRQLSGAAPCNILDAGSGIGAYTLRLARQFATASVVGWDLDPRKIELAEEVARESRIPNAHFLRRDICSDDGPGNAFDLVVCIDVLEHIHDYTTALRNLWRITRPGGFLFLHTPQPDQRRVFKRFYAWRHLDHAREGFLKDELGSHLEAAGFTVLSVRESFGLPGRLAWEMNHMALARSQILAGSTFPLLELVAMLDPVVPKRYALATAVIAKKPGNMSVPRS